MVIENETPGRGYPLPAPSNRLADDVLRLIAALTEVDADAAAILAALADKASSEHTHAISDVVGLVSALAALAPLVHTHGLSTLTGVSIVSPATGHVLTFSGGVWVNRALAITDVVNLSATLTSLSTQIATIDGGTY